MLLDDVLSALDAHTTRSIMDDCIGGPLMKGRTVLLVTHFIAIAGEHAERFFDLGSNGIITVYDSLPVTPTSHKDISISSIAEKELVDEHLVDESQNKDSLITKPVPDGRLAPAEDIAIGRVAAKACEPSSLALDRSYLISSTTVMLFLPAMGGVVYWIMLGSLTAANEIAAV